MTLLGSLVPYHIYGWLLWLWLVAVAVRPHTLTRKRGGGYTFKAPNSVSVTAPLNLAFRTHSRDRSVTAGHIPCVLAHMGETAA